MRIVQGVEAAQARLLARQPLGRVRLSPGVKARMKAAFGRPLSAEEAVRRILLRVRREGDKAVLDFTGHFDGVALTSLEVERGEWEAAFRTLEPQLKRSLELAADRVRRYHLACRPKSWLRRRQGLGQLVRPLGTVGIYVPGGTAAYPSTVLMTAIPARVAGVGQIVMATPPGRDGKPDRAALAAAHVAGVTRVFAMGGAQAIAAMAYGTATVPRVDKVCGPGNIFVTLAKRQLFGQVGIDGLHGPTETVIIADGTADPRLCAADLLAQAEHDVLATPILITTSRELAQRVKREVDKQARDLARRALALESLKRRGGIAVVASVQRAIALAEEFAPEHLCLLVAEPWRYVERITNAGGLFLGEASPEVLGDYVAGPSHVMPTGGTARFSSLLGVEDFVKRVGVVALSRRNIRPLAQAAAVIAEAEGLTAHARAAQMRLEPRSRRQRSTMRNRGTRRG
ncbi:MAG: histidinol dehydrogenase [Chloroflexi bacterium]|nr:histidinol dehydrogenase [Chloroflexota bacterium]